ncbi:MAG: methylenetetrahydrofolate reductase [Clostridia bacterium]
MKITEILSSGRVTVSCELFPPKPGQPLEGALRLVRETAQLSPSFISVTCGAAGTASGNTCEMAREAQSAGGVTALAHLVCMGSSRARIDEALCQLRADGIENILALRGDVPPSGERTGCYPHASDLTSAIARYGGFCVGGACYPEGHPESHDLAADIEGLKRKVDAGCAFLTTQMFFDNSVLYSFLFRLLRAGVTVPVIAGIMPVTNAAQITRILHLSGGTLPPRFRAILDRFQDNPPAMRQAGVAYATEQIIDLIACGVNNVHLYTMNKPEIAAGIMRNLSEIFR